MSIRNQKYVLVVQFLLEFSQSESELNERCMNIVWALEYLFENGQQVAFEIE